MPWEIRSFFNLPFSPSFISIGCVLSLFTNAYSMYLCLCLAAPYFHFASILWYDSAFTIIPRHAIKGLFKKTTVLWIPACTHEVDLGFGRILEFQKEHSLNWNGRPLSKMPKTIVHKLMKISSYSYTEKHIQQKHITTKEPQAML